MAVRKLLARMGVDPYLFALIGAVALAALVPARGVGAEFMHQATYGAVALLFFLYGARLSPRAVVEGLTHWRLQSLVFAATFILFPLLGLLVSAAARPFLPADLALGLLFATLPPSTIQSSVAFTAIARGNVPAALCSASVSNLLGVVLTPMLVAWLIRAYGAGFSAEALGDVAAQLLLPFALGQLCRPLIGKWLIAHKRLTSFVDRGSILLIVYAAFSEGVVAGVWAQLDWRSLALVLALDSAILAAVLVATTLASRRFGFSKEDEIAIVFCGSKKSMASGIPMANILFSGQALGLIVLPLMLFHQLQLFACATLAQRYARRPFEFGCADRRDLGAAGAGRAGGGLDRRAAGGGRLGNFDQPAAAHVIDIAIDRDVRRDQRMRADAPHVFGDARLEILEGQPFDIVAVDAAGAGPMIMPAMFVDRRRIEALFQQAANDLVVEQLHAAIAVMDDEPLIGAEQLVRDDQRADGVVAGAPAGVADHMRVAFRKPSIFGRIEPRVHAGQDREFTARRQGQLALFAEIRGVAGVGGGDFRDDPAHDRRSLATNLLH